MRKKFEIVLDQDDRQNWFLKLDPESNPKDFAEAIEKNESFSLVLTRMGKPIAAGPHAGEKLWDSVLVHYG